MGQEDIIASQYDRLSSQRGLFEHLSHLQRLNTLNFLFAFHQRQEKTLAPLKRGQLRQPTPAEWQEYVTDLGQRCLLFWDTLRQRGDNTLAHERAGYPLLLKFDHETLIAGPELPHPVNYSLLRILPGPEQEIDSNAQPVVIIDPRGGHGSGIGGFKQDSVLGESLRAGHPTYFISFSHSPQPGQTLAHIAEAQARFIEVVGALHPANSKPIIIGNCQAGWALMGLAATRPELPGLIIINGAPLSYWAGVNGRNPMRYTGGLLGGGWLARLGSDLGNGRFDGSWLVSNFENLDPANTYWGKYYQLFSQVDSEAARFLDFERWWGSPTLLNGEEIEMIVDDLFIGNQLSGGLDRKSSGIDLKRIEVPVVVFCSYGDNITPPQQALNWIADVYPSDLALHEAGRTIVYLRHASIGHLGIFVSGKVARREHRGLLGAVEAISALPAGLYEMLIDDLPASSGSNNVQYRVQFESRRIADIHDDIEPARDDDREFSLVERISEINSAFYDGFIRPWLRPMVNEPIAELMRRTHPFHQQQLLWSSLNPALWWLTGSLSKVSSDRRPACKDNPLLAWQELFSNQMQDTLNAYRDARDATQELCFYGIYGALNALTGNKPARNLQAHADRQDQALIERLQDSLPHGGPLEALVRILFLLGRDSDKAGKESIEKLIQQVHLLVQDYSNEPTALREAIRLQNLLVFAHPQESLRTLPLLLPEAKERQQVLTAVGQLIPELLATTGAKGEFWRELHALLEVPLPGFSLTQPPSETVVIPQQDTPAEPSPLAATLTPQITPTPAPAIVVKAPKRKASRKTKGPKPQ
jgi:pimeloyl-ACP methyl ester carboxylesterase